MNTKQFLQICALVFLQTTIANFVHSSPHPHFLLHSTESDLDRYTTKDLMDFCTFAKHEKCSHHKKHCRKGPTGPSGATGSTGSTGPTGPIGPTGTFSGEAWLTTGNSGTDPAVNFLGTTDMTPFILSANNNDNTLPRVRFTPNGQIEILSTGQSVFLGEGAGINDTIGAGVRNTFIGYEAGMNNTIETDNTALGYNTLLHNTASNNTAIGSSALASNTSGTDNTATGSEALFSNVSGQLNTAIGFQALFSNTANFNTALGYRALFGNTSGIQNVAVGVNTLDSNTTGISNTALGHQALSNNTTGQNNTAVGLNALATNQTTDENTALGIFADVSVDGLTNATALGSRAIVNASNKVRIGNTSVTVIEGQVAFSFPSDGRIKIVLNEQVPGLEFITKLRPVLYRIDMDQKAAIMHIPNEQRSKETEALQGQIVRTGFIAQEVEKTAKKIGYDFDGVNKPENEDGYYGLSYSTFVVPLVKAIQEQQAMIEQLKKEIEELKNN